MLFILFYTDIEYKSRSKVNVKRINHAQMNQNPIVVKGKFSLQTQNLLLMRYWFVRELISLISYKVKR